MSTIDTPSVHRALRRAFLFALALGPAACGASVAPTDGNLPDAVRTDGDVTCFDPSTGRSLRVGESNGAQCPCVCTDQGLACASCPQPICTLSDGRILRGGESAIAPDGCNTCTCDTRGQLGCTEIACMRDVPDTDATEPPPDATSCTAQVTWEIPQCQALVTYPCGVPGGPVTSSGDARCSTLCSPVNNGTVAGFCMPGPTASTVRCGACGVGRFTDGLGLDACDRDDADTFAGWLARGAGAEHIAAIAFARLADELASMGAPEALVAQARESAAHEHEHCDVMRSFARAEGVEPTLVSDPQWTARSLADIAIENAGEGCVRETLGAVVMAWQAEHAESAQLRAALAKIAGEESAHASWSWSLDQWARSVLDADTIAAMDRARDHAIDELRASMATDDPSAALSLRAGMPSARVVSAMIHELDRSLWSASSAR